jgi:predicted unusual protein kinase regulating ubiquinone biosynthesis (AarF/ABC1/UbiB family)
VTVPLGTPPAADPRPPAPRPAPDPPPDAAAAELQRELRRALAERRPARDRIDPRRYRKLRRFLVRTFAQALWYDLVLALPPLRPLRRRPLARWQRVARRYRALAVEMGGVLIKIGQFLSTRVDLLPVEITRELSGLQDEVPPAPFDAVVERIEADFGRPVGEVFAELDPEALGAASLAQVHRAKTAAGDEVVVKVLRPGIEVLVETDLAAVGLAARWLKLWKRLRRRVDFDRLTEEIVSTTRAELDLEAEGKNAERFAADFAGDPGVGVPRVYWEHTARHTLCLEDVSYLKIADHPALGRAGIDRGELAQSLYRLYMRQNFVHDFVHADPHPGNLFVRPLPEPDEEGLAGFGPGETPPPRPGRRFQIVFVDFGMVASIPPRLRSALREYAIALGTRDAARMVRAYQAAGVLLPGADLERLIDIHQELFERFWGVRIGELRATALSEARYFFRRYRDVLWELPFQVQVDLLFVSRAVGLLAGMATNLDPEFDPWAETIPFAERLAAEEVKRSWGEELAELVRQARLAVELPERMDRFLARSEQGLLTVQAGFTAEARRLFERLERDTRRLVWVVTASGLLIAAVTLRAMVPGDPLAPWIFGLAGLAFAWGLIARR